MAQANRSRTRVVIAAAVVVASAVVVTSLYRISRPPARRQVVVPVDPNDGWETAHARGTSNLGTIDETTRARQAFVDRYPRSPATPDVLNQLGTMYMQQKKFAESIRAYEQAKRLVADGVAGAGAKAAFAPSLGILDVNMAHTYHEARDFARAEAILKEVMARPLPPRVETETYVPQVVVAPLLLADMREDQKRPAEAEALRRATADRALELANANPSEYEWMVSYAASAYTKRSNVLLASKPPRLDAARALAEEFRQRAPAYRGMLGYDDMIAGVAHVEMREKAAASNTPASTPPVGGTSPPAP